MDSGANCSLNMEVTEISLSEEELKTLDELFPEGAFAGTRNAAHQMGMVVNSQGCKNRFKRNFIVVYKIVS